MRAVWYEKHGPAKEVLQVGKIETPEPGSGEILVRIFASGINPSDTKARLGGRPVKWPLIVPHSDGAGVVEQVGAGVDPDWVNQRVWVYNGQWERSLGTAAEYIALPADQVVPLPGSVSFIEGACLGIPAMTAHRCLFADGPVSDQIVLVTGGAGAVGHYAIQLAKWGGATVITTVSSDQKAERTVEAGVDYVFNYREEDVAARIAEVTDNNGVDRIVDVEFGGNLPVSQKVINDNGSISTYASMGEREPKFPFYSLMRTNINIRLVFVYTMLQTAKAQACKDIVEAIEDQKLIHSIGPSFSLEDTAAAHELIESRDYIGNVVLELN